MDAKLSRLDKLMKSANTAINVNDIVTMGLMNPEVNYPSVVQPMMDDVNVFTWVKNNASLVERHLSTHGALLFRGFNIYSVQAFEYFVQSLQYDILTYAERSSPRKEVHKNIYTSTEHPPEEYINMHNEHSYTNHWPLKIIFYCLQPSEDRGETPIADSRKVLQYLREETKQKFRSRGVLYVRNIGNGIGLPWQEVFQTDDRVVVEEYCSNNDIDIQWLSEENLILRFVRPAIRVHPKTNEEVWFNHAFFFNILSLDVSLQQVLSKDLDRYMPYQTFYGDGSKIEKEVIEEIRSVYEKVKFSFPWKKGDVLVLDNMLMAHGRNPFKGERKILVAMVEQQ